MKINATILLFMALSCVLAANSFAGNAIGPRPENVPVYIGNEPLPDVPYSPSGHQSVTSPGIIVGTTQYDYQSNGSSGNRCVRDSQGGVHFVWMNGISYPDQRGVFYNYVDVNGNLLGPTTVSQVNRAGYTQVDITTDDLGGIVYHSSLDPSTENYVTMAIDNFTGFGIFRYVDPPDMLSIRCYWPYLTVDRNNVFHVISSENPPNAGDNHAFGYTNSIDTGTTWSAFVAVDTNKTLSPVIVSSPVSDKVAIVYTHPLGINDTQWENDVYFIESQDGLTWDWRFGKMNVTNYGPPDSLYAYADLAAIYDYNDNLHIIWNAQWVTDAGIYYKTFLLHFDRDSGTITEMHSTIDNWIAGCDFGVWNRAVTKMSLGVCEGGNSLAAVYTAFDTSDCSAGGYANGEIYTQYSTDDGASWMNPVNLTNSPSPGCAPGNCESDHWATVADIIDENMYIVYIEDKDAGGIPQTEGTVTDNPVRFLELPMPYCPTGVDSDGDLPVTFRLEQNYPNPFNAETMISFELGNNADVDLSVYSITGAKVATLINGNLEAGNHSVAWDAGDYSSGVYFYRLMTDLEQYTKRMTLLK